MAVTFPIITVLAVIAAVGFSVPTPPLSTDARVPLVEGLIVAENVINKSVKKLLNETYSTSVAVVDALVDVYNLMEHYDSFSIITADHESNKNTTTTTELTVVKVLLEKIIEDYCFWIFGFNSKNCSAESLKSIGLLIKTGLTISTVSDSVKNSLTKIGPPISGISRCEWIKCNFWCNSDINKDVTKYILSFFGCPSSFDCDVQCNKYRV